MSRQRKTRGQYVLVKTGEDAFGDIKSWRLKENKDTARRKARNRQARLSRRRNRKS